MSDANEVRRDHMTRRTFRLSDEDWAAGHARATADGEHLTDVIRRLLSGYLVDGGVGEGYEFRYRAVPTTPGLSEDQREALTVSWISGRFEDVRRLYPSRSWRLEECTVSSYRPAVRKGA